jgi:predicted solute-binding protein
VTQRALESLRIGCVQYLNAKPLIHGWPGPVDFDHPTALCRKLADSELDVALVSSFEFLRHPIYAIVDGLAIAADGPVHSVFLALAGPIEEVDEIELDSASQTSVNLLRCLLAEHRFRPRVVAASLDREKPISRSRAKLMIGDEAIRFREQHEKRYEYWDLAAQWKRSTGLPFVFALWLIRPEVENAQLIADALRQRRDENLASLDQIIAAQTEFPSEFCAYYFRECLRFEFADAEKEGLLRFRSLCEMHGILPPNANPLRFV